LVFKAALCAKIGAPRRLTEKLRIDSDTFETRRPHRSYDIDALPRITCLALLHAWGDISTHDAAAIFPHNNEGGAVAPFILHIVFHLVAIIQ